MKTLTIGESTLELNSFRKIRDKVVGVYAEIVIPTTAISFDDLKALFTNNQHDLIVTEEDGSTTTYSGYAELEEAKENLKKGVYTVIQVCTSEAIHLLNEARKQIEALELEKAELQNEVKVQAKAIIDLNQQLLYVQLAAAELYEKSLEVENAEEVTEGATDQGEAQEEAPATEGIEEAAEDSMGEITEPVEEQEAEQESEGQ